MSTCKITRFDFQEYEHKLHAGFLLQLWQGKLSLFSCKVTAEVRTRKEVGRVSIRTLSLCNLSAMMYIKLIGDDTSKPSPNPKRTHLSEFPPCFGHLCCGFCQYHSEAM